MRATGSANKFYLYDWPIEMSDAYPSASQVLQGNMSDYNADFKENDGAGIALDATIGLYQTWQYALFKNIYGRLQVSKYRTW